ncbi:putative transcription factor GRAS family [Dioscorea sansibarensis]
MKEEYLHGGEELLLSLSLGINGHWSSSDAAKKRKRKDDDNDNNNNNNDDIVEKKLVGLLQVRDQMMKPNNIKTHTLDDSKGLHLIHLLLLSASAMDDNNVTSAIDTLTELFQKVSLNGDPIQRVAAYFSDGLVAKLLTKKSPLFSTIMTTPTPEEKFTAFTELYRASPYYQFAHFTANQTIIEAFELEDPNNSRCLHVIDFDVSYGFQWPSLIQSLSDKASSDKPIFLRVSGFGRSLDELKETEMRLASFAKGCKNLVFEFEGLVKGCTNPPSINELKIKKNATVVVNLVLYLSTLKSHTEISETLTSIHRMNPSAVVVVDKEGGRNCRSFLSIFMESLHYYAAMFDSLEDCLPAESSERLSIEKNHLGREIKSCITSEVMKKEEDEIINDKFDTWKGMMESIGYEGVRLSSRSLSQAKLLLKIKSHCSSMELGSNGGFQVVERDGGMCISLGWQDRNLVTASAWHHV